MPELVASDLTPKVPDLLFNYEQETAAFLRRLVAPPASEREGWLRLATVQSPFDILAERFVLHASKLAPSLIGDDVYLFWHRFHATSSTLTLFRQFRDFLAERWVHETPTTFENELAVLTFDDVEALTEQNLRDAIRSLFLRLRSSHAIVVVECVEAPGERRLREIVAFFDSIVRTPTRAAITLVFVGNAPEIARAVDGYNAVSATLNELPKKWRAEFSRELAPGLADAPARSGAVSAEALRLVLPLSALQSGVTQHIVHYIVSHLGTSDADVGQFVGEHLVVRLLHGLDLSAAGRHVAMAHRDETAELRDYDSVVSNGTRLLSFVPPENLRGTSTLAALDRYANENFRLIDLTAALLKAPRAETAAAVRRVADLTEELRRNQPLFDASNERHHKTLIAYLSQLLIRQRYGLDFAFFRYLEMLTMGFGEYLIARGGSRTAAAYEASRMLSNLAFVYDHLAVRPPAVAGVKESIHERTQRWLSEARPTDPAEIADFGYLLGWHNAGDRAKAVSIFVRTAMQLLPQSNPELEEPADRIPIDLLAIAFVMAGGRLEDRQAAAALERWVRRTGIFSSLEKLRQFLFEGSGSLDLGHCHFGVRSQVVLYFCRYDFIEALHFARTLLVETGAVARLEVVRDRLSLVRDKRLLHAIIGAPDTPDGVGEFISRVRPLSAYLYQLKSIVDFTDVDQIEHDGYSIVTVSGSGLRSSLNEWRAFLRDTQRLILKEDPMQELLLGAMISTVFGGAGTRLGELMIDSIIDKVRGKLGTSDDPKDQERQQSELEDLRRDLTTLQQRVEREAELPSRDVVKELHLEEKSPDVRSSIGTVLAPGGVAEVVDSVFVTLESLGSDVRQLRSIADGMMRIANRVPNVRPLSMDEERELHPYQEAFHAFRAEADELLRQYNAHDRVDDAAVGRLVRRFCNSSRKFAGLLRALETAD